jgi:hypothetical protein
MSAREDLIAKLDKLSEDQIAKILRDVETMAEELSDNDKEIEEDAIIGIIKSESTTIAENAEIILSLPRRTKPYDPAKDKMRKGLFNGPPDLAERSSEILRAEFGIKEPHPQSEDEVE